MFVRGTVEKETVAGEGEFATARITKSVNGLDKRLQRILEAHGEQKKVSAC
jgi:hypothetical protein